MAVKERLAILMIAVIAPIFMVCVDIRAFWVATSFIMLFFSLKSLINLCILNFASDEFYEKHSEKVCEYQSAFSVLTDAILMCGAYALILIMLFISFFLFKSPMIKGISLILMIMWGYDFYKVFSKPDEDEDWSIKDTIKEILIWGQGILSVIFTITAQFMF